MNLGTSESGLPEHTAANIRGMCGLVVEDQEVARDLMQSILTSWGLNVQLAESAEQGLEIVLNALRAGDECLRKIARTLEASLSRPGDIVARYGGEEFVAILPDCDQTGAVAVAEKMRCNMEKLDIKHTHSPVVGHVTISIGVTSRQSVHEETWQDMLLEVDQALYSAKTRGRNKIFVATI